LRQTRTAAGKGPPISTCKQVLRTFQPDNAFGRCRQLYPPRFAYVAMMMQKNGQGSEHKFLAMQ
jgi:hypothetical protein